MRRSHPRARFDDARLMPEKRKPHAEAHGSENQEVIIKIKLSDITEKKGCCNIATTYRWF